LAHFSQVEVKNLPLDNFQKPIAVPPPKTFREAKMCPWWPHYEKAAQVEYKGHLENKTWTLVPRTTVPPGKLFSGENGFSTIKEGRMVLF
jgi:hypothetical protein